MYSIPKLQSHADNYELRGAQISTCETTAVNSVREENKSFITQCCAVGLQVMCYSLAKPYVKHQT